MLRFVNAKINLGLNILRRRPDGYHDLETLFYPVGLYNGTPACPQSFCDILEITPLDAPEDEFRFTGRPVDCPPEKNLVVKAARAFRRELTHSGISQEQRFLIHLEKHLPDGAGLGGGSADATFTLLMLNELCGFPLSRERLLEMAAALGADCPFFIENRPVYASGIGERMTPADVDLSGRYALVVKPPVSISTREAFSGVSPRVPAQTVREITSRPLGEWRGRLCNDFEASIFQAHPLLARLKEEMYSAGAEYAAMSGSGASIVGIYPTPQSAEAACTRLLGVHAALYTAVCLL